MNHIFKNYFHIFIVIGLLCSGCASLKSNSIDQFAESQKSKISEAEVFNEADFVFWAAAYVPRTEDLQNLRSSWVEAAEAFPKSTPISDIETAIKANPQGVVLVGLFFSEYELADLKSKTLGWTIGPAPKEILELDEKDVQLRTLMPLKNNWARYFLVKFDRNSALDRITISKREFKVSLNLK